VIVDYIIVNIYIYLGPALKTDFHLYKNLLNEVWAWSEQYKNCKIIIAGDCNTDLDKSFIHEHSPARLDEMLLASKTGTYVNDALKQQSAIDYILTASRANSINYKIINPGNNFSQYLLIVGIFTFANSYHNSLSRGESDIAVPTQLRWGQGDIVWYYHYTRCHLQPILCRVEPLELQHFNCEVLDYKLYS
jgi:hypothetical protein